MTRRSGPANRPASLDHVETYLRGIVLRNSPPGLSVAVVKDGETVYLDAFGFADAPAAKPAGPDTVYHWWSMTKLATAAAVLQLTDDGLLDLDADVSDYLPFFSVQGDKSVPITSRQLLRHTSGLPDPIPAMIGWVHFEDEIYKQTDLLRQKLPQYDQLKFAPGTDAAYSNLGYMVLGAVIESITGMAYEDVIRQRVLQPLEMEHTDFYFTSELVPLAAAGSHPLISIYTPLLPSLLDLKALVRERRGSRFWFNPVYIDATPPSGLLGSVRDAALLANALLSHHEFLSGESHARMRPSGPMPADRPLGWAEFNQGNRPWLQHRGGGPGFATIMRIYPNESLGVVVMANGTHMPDTALVDALAGFSW